MVIHYFEGEGEAKVTHYSEGEEVNHYSEGGGEVKVNHYSEE